MNYPDTKDVWVFLTHTNKIWKKHAEVLRNNYWKENTFWSDGYFVCSTGNANMETIKKYIEEQG